MATPITTPTQTGTKLVKTAEVAAHIGACSATALRMTRRSNQPQPVRWGKLLRWDLAVVEAHLSSKQGGQK